MTSGGRQMARESSSLPLCLACSIHALLKTSDPSSEKYFSGCMPCGALKNGKLLKLGKIVFKTTFSFIYVKYRDVPT
jgi:hypothetical protein